MLIHDWTQASWHNQYAIDKTEWRRLFVCSQIDRHILKKMDEYINSGRFSSFASLKDTVGLNFSIKDNEKIDPQYLLSADHRNQNYWKVHLGRDNRLFDPEQSIVPLPLEQLEKSSEAAKLYLTGHVVLMPRTCETAIYFKEPIATKSFVIGSFNQNFAETISNKQTQFLKAVAAYMATDVFRYFCFVNGRRMMTDRKSIELSAVMSLPWPFGDLDDPQLKKFVGCSKDEREKIVLSMLGLHGTYEATIKEFTAIRAKYSDGATPAEVIRRASDDQISKYTNTLFELIDRDKGRYEIETYEQDENLIATKIVYLKSQTQSKSAVTPIELAHQAYKKQGSSGITQSRFVWHSKQTMTTVLIKPNELVHWTMDRAFSDADLVIAAAMSGIESKHFS